MPGKQSVSVLASCPRSMCGGCFCDCKREAFSPIAGDGFNTVVPRNREFETVVNAFRFYNCNGEMGLYPAFYVKMEG